MPSYYNQFAIEIPDLSLEGVVFWQRLSEAAEQGVDLPAHHPVLGLVTPDDSLATILDGIEIHVSLIDRSAEIATTEESQASADHTAHLLQTFLRTHPDYPQTSISFEVGCYGDAADAAGGLRITVTAQGYTTASTSDPSLTYVAPPPERFWEPAPATVAEPPTSARMLSLVEPDGGWFARAHAEGMVEIVAISGPPLVRDGQKNVSLLEAKAKGMTSTIVIDDLDAMIQQLQALQVLAQRHFPNEPKWNGEQH